MMYKGSAPISIITTITDLNELQSHADPYRGKPWDADASMICRRLKVYKFATRVAKPGMQISYCGHCFGQLLHSCSASSLLTQPSVA